MFFKIYFSQNLASRPGRRIYFLTCSILQRTTRRVTLLHLFGLISYNSYFIQLLPTTHTHIYHVIYRWCLKIYFIYFYEKTLNRWHVTILVFDFISNDTRKRIVIIRSLTWIVLKRSLTCLFFKSIIFQNLKHFPELHIPKLFTKRFFSCNCKYVSFLRSERQNQALKEMKFYWNH